MRLYKLSNKLVIRVRRNACEFLKGYTSNVLEAPRNAFLDIHGKIVAVFDQKVLSADDVLIVIERQFFERLKSHLGKFLAFGNTTLEEEKYNVYFDLDGDYGPNEDDFVIPVGAPLQVITRKQLPTVVSDQEFTLFRLKNNIPVQGIDYDEELLLNVADEELVSYTKGCYLGQEIIARAHYRSKPPKKLVVKSEDECTPEEKNRLTSRTPDLQTGRTIGFVFVVNSNRG